MERPHFFKVRSGKITVCTMCRTKVWIDIKVFGGEEQFNHSRHMFPIKQKFNTKAFLDNQKKPIWSILENCWDKCANRMHYLQNWTNWNIFITKKLLFYEIHSPKSWGLKTFMSVQHKLDEVKLLLKENSYNHLYYQS